MITKMSSSITIQSLICIVVFLPLSYRGENELNNKEGILVFFYIPLQIS